MKKALIILQIRALLRFSGTRSRDRTGMGKAHWFLRPARLPIPPSGHGQEDVRMGVGMSVGVGCEDNRFGSVVQINPG